MNASDRVQREVERAILNGRFQPGQQITEFEVAQRLGVSRGPVREALRALVAQGLVEVIPNRGVFVRSAQVAEVCALFDIRIALSDLIAAQVVDTIRNADIALMRAEIDVMDRLARPDTVDDYLQANIRFHRVIHGLSANRRAAELDAALGKELVLYRRRGLVAGGGLAQSNQEHRRIVAALERRDAVQLCAELRAHVGAGRARFLASLDAPPSPNPATEDQNGTL